MLSKYRKASFNYAVKIGLTSGLTEERIKEGYDFICREGWARRLGVAVIRQLDPKIKVKQMGLYNGYDQEFPSGGTVIRMEIKCRRYIRTFKEAAISANENKGGFIESGKGWILEYYDILGKWWIWDLEQYTPEFRPKSYRHYKWTAAHKDNYMVVEDAYYFDRSKATYSGTT